MDRITLSLYLDDTDFRPAGAYATFLEFATGEGIAGKSSLIMASREKATGLLAEKRTADHDRFLHSVRRARLYGFDTHMEFMTHGRLWDFKARRVLEGAPHESIWVYEPRVTREDFLTYFDNIINEGHKVGVSFTGVSFPGCNCAECLRRWQQMNATGTNQVNPELWQALLTLAKDGKFGAAVVPCFVDVPNGGPMTKLMAANGDAAIYDVRPDLEGEDRLGFGGVIDPDFYINETGTSGAIVELLRAGAPRCIFNVHWFSMKPVNGRGWYAFCQVVKRIHKYHRNDIEWMPPTEYVKRLHDSKTAASARSPERPIDSHGWS